MKPFESPLGPQLEQFIAYRKTLGYTAHNLRSQLRGFDRYVCEMGASLEDLTPPFFLGLKKSFQDKQQTFNKRLLAMRGFFHYLVRCQIVDENPLIHIESYRERAFIPFVFSPDQVEQLLKAAQYAIRKKEAFFFKDFTAYMAILLFARCAMRLNEPLRLKVEHYSPSEATVYIEKTKFSKDRLIPIQKILRGEMDNYLNLRHGFITDQNPYLLPGSRGRALSDHHIYKMFHGAVKAIGLEQPRRIIANTTFGRPTPHCLRHSFAINTLKRIKEQGRSPQQALPVLSTYLGHRKYRYTAVYLKVLDAEHRQGLVDFAISRQEEI